MPKQKSKKSSSKTKKSGRSNIAKQQQKPRKKITILKGNSGKGLRMRYGIEFKNTKGSKNTKGFMPTLEDISYRFIAEVVCKSAILSSSRLNRIKTRDDDDVSLNTLPGDTAAAAATKERPNRIMKRDVDVALTTMNIRFLNSKSSLIV